jgi:hypothetical protein
VKIRNVSFDVWLRSHGGKTAEERWLRELYPWPVLARVEYDPKKIGHIQKIQYDQVDYDVTLMLVRWQPRQETFRYRIRVDSEGLGWHARSFSDEFDLCAGPDGNFVTLFHSKTEEPLEKIARAFFGRRWGNLRPELFQSLAVSRFLAASIVAHIVECAFSGIELTHYPGTRLIGSTSPMFASESALWIGYRFFSEDAYTWARQSAKAASKVIALYFADTKYQFRTDLPSNVKVHSIIEFDNAELHGQFEELIRVLLRNLELPKANFAWNEADSIVRGLISAPSVLITEADVHEALAAIRLHCNSKSDLRYQLAAGVVLNAWIENERRLGHNQRKKFYAFKERIGSLVTWAAEEELPGVEIWIEILSNGPLLFVRVDDVDFSFHAIPGAEKFYTRHHESPVWSGVRLKPIAPIVLAWARALRDR